MTRPKSHLELYGWEIRRTAYHGHFYLFLRWSPFPVADGPLAYIAWALNRFLAA